MRDFEAAGLTGILIVVLTLGLVAAGVVCAIRRVPRPLAIALVAAGIGALIRSTPEQTRTAVPGDDLRTGED